MDNLKKLGAIIPALISQVKANAQEQPLSNPPSNSAMPLPLMHDERGKAELSILLLQCYEALKVYGKEPEQLKSVNAVFQLALADYRLHEFQPRRVPAGFKVYRALAPNTFHFSHSKAATA